MNTSFDPITGVNGSDGAKNGLVSTKVMTDTGKNYVAFTGNTDTTYYIMATLPLKIIHDLFKKLPLTKGMYMRLVLNLNTQCQSVVTINAGENFETYATTSLNNVFPCMLSPIATTNGFILNAATRATISLGIGKSFNTTTSFTHPTMQS